MEKNKYTINRTIEKSQKNNIQPYQIITLNVLPKEGWSSYNNFRKADVTSRNIIRHKE